MNTKIKREDVQFIKDHDADVYCLEGTEGRKLLLRFRKKQLSDKNVKEFYDNVIKFAMNKTSNRGSASGSEKKNIFENPKIMSNIIGYYDKFSPSKKVKLKQQGQPIPKLTVRKTRFLAKYPERFKKALPLIQEIDSLYEQLVPDYYAKQKQKATETPFHIAGTSFTTVTTNNVNYTTSIHKDRGDRTRVISRWRNLLPLGIKPAPTGAQKGAPVNWSGGGTFLCPGRGTFLRPRGSFLCPGRGTFFTPVGAPFNAPVGAPF